MVLTSIHVYVELFDKFDGGFGYSRGRQFISDRVCVLSCSVVADDELRRSEVVSHWRGIFEKMRRGRGRDEY